MVYVNDQLKGTSPVTYDFLWYGWHRLTLRKAGFERLDDRKPLRAPVYLWIPFDLAMELAPFPIRDERTWSYTLTPTVTPPSPVPPELLTPATEPGPPASDASRTTAIQEAVHAAESSSEPSHDPAR